jgi:DNA-binding XRE family transcriptional regulator
MDSPVAEAKRFKVSADGKLSPDSHPQTVGCVTPTRRASSACDMSFSARYSLSRSMEPNIGESDKLSIGNPYILSAHYSWVKKKSNAVTVWIRLKDALKDARLPETQVYAARLAGVKQPSVSDWNKPGTGPELDTAILIAKKLNICVEWLYTGRGPQRPGLPDDPIARQLWAIWPKVPAEHRERILGYAHVNALPAPPGDRELRPRDTDPSPDSRASRL